MSTPGNNTMPDPGTNDKIPQLILALSGTMVGACATMIGLVKVMEAHAGPSRVDQYAAGAAGLFLFSALFAYLTLRAKIRTPLHARFELAADVLFILGLAAIGVIGGMFAYDLV